MKQLYRVIIGFLLVFGLQQKVYMAAEGEADLDQGFFNPKHREIRVYFSSNGYLVQPDARGVDYMVPRFVGSKEVDYIKRAELRFCEGLRFEWRDLNNYKGPLITEGPYAGERACVLRDADGNPWFLDRSNGKYVQILPD